jgi:hypothetical protein
MEVQQDFKELLALLNEHKVEYVIVGGYGKKKRPCRLRSVGRGVISPRFIKAGSGHNLSNML